MGRGDHAQQAGALARATYDAKLAAQVRQAREQAWAAVPPKTAVAVENAARRTRQTARTAADYTVPRVGSAVAATRAVAVPVTNEALLRGAAAIHALRGQVTAAEIDRLVRKRVRRERTGRAFRGVLLAGVVAINVAVLRLNLQLDETGRERTELRTDIQRLRSEISSAAATTRIERLAEGELGLVEVQPEDTTYIQLGR